jgi:hypothetical protein
MRGLTADPIRVKRSRPQARGERITIIESRRLRAKPRVRGEARGGASRGRRGPSSWSPSEFRKTPRGFEARPAGLAA